MTQSKIDKVYRELLRRKEIYERYDAQKFVAEINELIRFVIDVANQPQQADD